MTLGSRVRHLAPGLLYAGLTLAIAYPLLGDGYVFALDHAMGPASAAHYRQYLAWNADPMQSKAAYALLVTSLDAVMPMAWAQRVLLFAPFLLAGLGMHRLAPGRTHATRAVGGVAYMLSPFAYVRGVVGQTGVLWAYALAPWFLHAWFHYRDTGSRRSLMLAVLLLALTAAFKAHGAVLLVGLVVVDTLVRLPNGPRRAVGPAARFLGLAALVHAYWVLPVLLAPQTTLDAVDAADAAFFAPRDPGLGSVGLAALTLQGFWRIGPTPYYVAHPALLAIPVLTVLLAVRGFLERAGDPRSRGLALAGIAGFWLAVGAAAPQTKPAFDLAWTYVPLFQGFRDSHKLLALLALAYAYLAPAGADALLDRLRTPGTHARRALAGATVALLVAAPVAGATPLLHGFSGQLDATPYPAEWEAAEAHTAGCDGNLLVLPWHQYLDVSWVPNPDKRVVNPAKVYFTCPVLSGDTLDAGSVGGESPDPRNRHVAHLLHDQGLAHGNPEGIRDLGHRLTPLNVEYVLVLKEATWERLAPTLDAQEDLEPVVDNARVRVYRNLAHAPADAAPATAPATHRVPANAAADGIAFTPPPGAPPTGWTLDGRAPDAVAHGYAAHWTDADDMGGTITHTGFWRVQLPAWGVSALTLLAMGMTLARPHRWLAHGGVRS